MGNQRARRSVNAVDEFLRELQAAAEDPIPQGDLLERLRRRGWTLERLHSLREEFRAEGIDRRQLANYLEQLAPVWREREFAYAGRQTELIVHDFAPADVRGHSLALERIGPAHLLCSETFVRLDIKEAHLEDHAACGRPDTSISHSHAASSYRVPPRECDELRFSDGQPVTLQMERKWLSGLAKRMQRKVNAPKQRAVRAPSVKLPVKLTVIDVCDALDKSRGATPERVTIKA
jgi:hypothetical protein